ncbi:MAG: glycosyltransferase family 2 protein [Lachnospiraceae bacterium]|nr:glycosyltransferase family 2 protein [Lachnospiraceae bacterium]
MDREKTVDVCIPVYKPDPEFARMLQRLAEQDYPIRNLWIVNTEEKYWDTSFEKEYPPCHIMHISRNEFNHGGTRRLMAEKSDADLMLFMTQDAMPADRKLISTLVAAFEDPQVKAAYGRQLPRKDCRFLETYTRHFNYPDQSRTKGQKDLPELGIKTFFCSNVCAMYEKKTYLELGGFPERTLFNEDMIYAGGLVQAGYSIRYQAEARVIHSHNFSDRQQFHRNFDLAVSQAEYPEIFQAYPSEGEGFRLVKATAAYVCKKGKPWLVVPLFTSSVSKYAGYFLGKRYRKLPGWLLKRCTTDPGYFHLG